MPTNDNPIFIIDGTKKRFKSFTQVDGNGETTLILDGKPYKVATMKPGKRERGRNVWVVETQKQD